jgi:hypothetical protein
MTSTKYEDIKTYTLRLKSDLYEQIKQSADKNKRSIAKEIEFALEKYVNS